MALSIAQREQLLARTLPESEDVRRRLHQYMDRSGLTLADFAKRINYSSVTVNHFLIGRYSVISGNDRNIRAAITDFIEAHPLAPATEIEGKLYETGNVKLLRKYFYQALDHRRAIYCHGAPGSQKSYVLQYLIAELNRNDIAKNGHGRRAYYVYCPATVRPTALLKLIAESCGVSNAGDSRRVIRNLRFEFRNRRVVIVLDEAQHLEIACLEAIRELFDLPPHFGLLLAGSHQLETVFTRNSIALEQWNSRFHFGQALPGISEDEAEMIIGGELGPAVTKAIVAKLIKESRATDLRLGGEHKYISARRLFWALADISDKLAERKGAIA